MTAFVPPDVIKRPAEALPLEKESTIVQKDPTTAPSKSLKGASNTKKEVIKSGSKPRDKPKPTKTNTIAAAFARQAENNKKPKEKVPKEKVVFADPKGDKPKEEEEEEKETAIKMKQTADEKARKKSELENMFGDDEDILGMS